MQPYIKAYKQYKPEAFEALALFRNMCSNSIPRVPGMDTVIRLAWRISCGRSVEEAAAREYRYRWALALQSSHFGVPHALGM